MKHIFLSYSRADTDTMGRVRESLSGEGLSVWTDENLTPGTPSWKQAIERAIEDAGCVVVLLSPEAKKSEWVANELGYANTHGIAVFPALIRGEEKEAVPLELINAQRIDARTRFLAAMQMLVDAVQAHLKTLEEPDTPTEAGIEWTNRSEAYVRFWKGLQERSKGRTELFVNLKPRDQYWMNTGIGRQGISLGYVLSNRWASVDLYIDTGDKQRNKAVFDALQAQQAAIEADFGERLEWLRLEHKRSSRIIRRFEEGGLTPTDDWPALQDRMIDAMIRLDRAFRERVGKIEV